MYLARSFSFGHKNVKSNNEHDNFRKKHCTMNLCVISENDECSNNDSDNAEISSFPSIKRLETEDIIIVGDDDHDDGSNDNTSDDGISFNEHGKNYFMSEEKCVGMTCSFECLLHML